MITVRKSEDRGHFDHGWLDTFHTFSFGHYRDPEHMGFRSLRVINDDVVAPGMGFSEHGHSDMEIVSYVVSGALAHQDSAGHQGLLRPGDVQRMSAGSGIRHSEFNGSREEPVRLLQIWILPDRKGHTPRYEDRSFPDRERRDALRLIVSRDGREGSLDVHQDAEIRAGLLSAGARVSREIADGKHAWVQVVNGSLVVNGVRLEKGDGAAVSDEKALEIAAGDGGAEVLVFELG